MISIIVAMGKNREIGKKNGLLWHIPEELKHFKQLTTGHPIIMGRKTYESIGRPLPGRTNIIITRHSISGMEQGAPKPRNLLWVNSLAQALKLAKKQPGGEEIFIIGGGQIFEQAIKIADKLYLTIIEKEFKGDTFFPDYSSFKKVSESEIKKFQGIKYRFEEWEK